MPILYGRTNFLAFLSFLSNMLKLIPATGKQNFIYIPWLKIQTYKLFCCVYIKTQRKMPPTETVQSVREQKVNSTGGKF